MTDRQRRTLRALCDTYIPAVEPPAVEADDPTGFWGRAASDLDVDVAVATYVREELSESDRAGMLRLLDLLGVTGFPYLPRRAREAALVALRRASQEVADGLDAFRVMTMAEFYGGTDPDGRNPNWAQLGYPGPPEVTEVVTARVLTFQPPPGVAEVTLDADVVVVGSGSGGGVAAGELAAAGRSVVVLESGPHVEDPDFPPDELNALRRLYWRSVPTTADGNVTLMAGRTLGGGSTVNWTNCVPPPDHVRELWAKDHGLHGLDGADFDRHLEAVLERISATSAASDINGPNDRLRTGAEALGWGWHRARRNTERGRYDPESAGHIGFGDRSGAKQGTLKTYLRDAADDGADIIVDCHVQRILTEGGRAAGVVARVIRPGGQEVALTVRAPQVVVAGGALETPALLLRSGIGGPAVGRHLRLHPVPNLGGFYPQPTRSWWGAPQTVIVDEHATALAGHGYLVETPHVHLAISAAAVPWRNGCDHKLVLGRGSNLATFIAVIRERGAGRVTVDEAGEPVVTYPVDDPLDRELIGHAVETLVRLHVAAGADAVVDLHPDRPLWVRGDDVDAFIDRIRGLPSGKGGRPLFSAHQMGTARMGTDPATSVADPEGQLHATPGVWIGDTSAFPTAVGSNPMVACMALARRTAHALLAAT
jgi:choline dehydrogenase-like flavoprotein